MQDTIETFLNLDELESKTLCDGVDNEETLEPVLNEVQLRYGQLQERLIALKAITETLKEQISTEKQLWSKELQETLAVEKQLKVTRSKHESGDTLLADMNTEDYRMKLQMFKDFMFFTNATKNMEKIVKKNNYQQWLYDVESKCNMELLKIQQSITILKPLQAIALRWNEEGENESGDHVSVKSESVPEIKKDVTISIEEVNETEVNETKIHKT